MFPIRLSKAKENRIRLIVVKQLPFESLNDADIISMPMFATCKVKMERIILFMRNRKSTYVFRLRVSKFDKNFSQNPAISISENQSLIAINIINDNQ